MESLDADMLRDNNASLTGEIRAYLTETAKWGMFLAVMGYIGIGLMVLVGIGVMVGAASQSIEGLAGNMGPFGLIYIALAVLYFFPVYYLHQFAVKMKQGLTSQDSMSITSGFENLKSLFKFMGIFCIVILSIYAVIIIVALLTSSL